MPWEEVAITFLSIAAGCAVAIFSRRGEDEQIFIEPQPEPDPNQDLYDAIEQAAQDYQKDQTR